MSVLEDCSGYCSVGYDEYLSLDTERVTATVLQAVLLCAEWKKTVWPVGEFVLQSWAENVYCHCTAIVTAIMLPLRSLIKTESRTATRCGNPLDSHGTPRLDWQMNQRMNEYQSLVFSSLSVCPFSTTLHGVFPFHVGWRTQVSYSTWMVPSNHPKLLQKQASEKHPPNRILMIWSYFVYFLEIFLNIFANQRKEDSLATLLFCEARLWSSLLEPENVPKPGPKSAENRSPLLCHFEYLQRNNVGQMLWKCAPCSVHCKPDYEMCSVKLCTRQMAMSSQWDKCHKMDVNSRKSNSYFWSLVGPTTEGTRSMHRSWW